MKAQLRHLSSSLLLFALLSVLGIRAVQAQSITPDSDTHTVISNPVSNPNQFDISGGTRAGNNLFHSFQQFGLSQGQTANFLSNPAIQNILGRVTGGNASMINGLIQVTGGNSNLFLMNPSGIIFGPNARLNVPASFMATTANGIHIVNGWFNATGFNNYANLSGNPDSFAFLGNPGAILNAGVLTANPGQNITLLGGVVVNTGAISAPGGTIMIAAIPGERLVRITQEGSLLSLVLPTEAATAINPSTNTPLFLAALLTGGTIPEATGITVENGVVKLTSNNRTISTEAGAAMVSGSLSTASNTLPNASQIQVLGDRVSLWNANLNASGLNGGVVRIGGDYQGSGTLPNARFAEVDANTTIRADAISAIGNGGNVVVWSTDASRFDGTITAQGGSNGGNGGLVETSGKQTLIVSPSASVSTRAPQGQAGTWLLDPPELTIGATGTATLAGSSPLTNTPTSATTISADAIVAGLNGSKVNLQAGNLITVNEIIDASGNASMGYLTFITPTATLNQPIILPTDSILNGSATTVNVNAGGRIQNGVDVAAAGATVNVTAGTFNVPGVVNQVSITKPLTVQGAGAGNTIIDGGSNSRGVYIDPGAGNTVNLDNLTIQYGYVDVDNGAGLLMNSGTLNLSNSAIIGNRAFYGVELFHPFGGNGGGIFNVEGTVNLTNSSIIGNLATSGGGIFNVGGTVNLINSSITDNSATNGGGGISTGGTVNLTNSIINGNSAYLQGGGISTGPGIITLTNSTINGNSAGLQGGGISAGRGTVNLANSTINGNLGLQGGGIFTEGTVNLTNSAISSNSAAYGGGGIYNAGDTINLNNSTINGNSAINGGGIYNSAGGTVNLTNSAVSSNSAAYGGGIYNYGSTISSTIWTFSPSGIYYISSQSTSIGKVTLTNSTLTNNSATRSGGGIYNVGGTVNLTNSTLSGNSAFQGGGIYNYGYTFGNVRPFYFYSGFSVGKVTLTNSTLTNNSATDSGGGIYNSETRNIYFNVNPDNVSSTTVNNSTLSGNFANSNGGGIYNNGTVQVSNSTITNNTAASGGGIHNAAPTDYLPAGTFIVRNTIIAGNSAVLGRELVNGGSSASEGYNLFGFNGSSGVEGMVLHATDIVPSVDITQILAPLGNYGGPTQTHRLVAGSPAINAGAPNVITPDQRGFVRVDRADIGAFEFQNTPLQSSSLPLFALADLNQISTTLLHREVEPMIIEFQPIPSSSILCVDRSQDRVEQEPNAYQGIPACAQ